MKKRLLSAALALAMVLTLLPLSAFAADEPTEQDAKDSGFKDGVPVTYHSRQDSSKVGLTAPGWYYHVTKTADNKTVDKYYKVSTGVVYTTSFSDNTVATWYSVPNHTIGTSGAVMSTGFTLLNDFTMSANQFVCPSSISVNLDGHTLDLSAGFYGGFTATNVTLTNSASSNAVFKVADTGLEISDRAFTLSMTNVKLGDSVDIPIKLSGDFSHSVTLTDCWVNSVSMTSANDANGYPTKRQSLSITRGFTEAGLTVTGDSSQVSLTDVRVGSSGAGAIALTGTSASLQLNGRTTVGAVTLLGRNDKDTNATPPSVSIAKESSVASIATIGGAALEKCTNPYSITVNGKVTSTIELNNANVTVDGGTVTGLTTITTGTVTAKGSGANFTGGVTLKDKATFDMTNATNCTVGAKITTDVPAQATVNIPATASNKIHSISDTYQKATINGGTWTNGLPNNNALASTLSYLLRKTSNGHVTYYMSNQLAEALVAQNSGEGWLFPKGQIAADNAGLTDYSSITFKNGSTTWGQLFFKDSDEIVLPEKVANVDTPNWLDTTTKIIYPKNSTYTLPKDGADKNRVLDAQGGGTMGVVSKLNDVAVVGNNSLEAKLNGTVITLSGAVDKNLNRVTVRLTTDALKSDGGTPAKDIPVIVDLDLVYNSTSKTFRFDNPSTAKVQELRDAGMSLETTSGGGLTTLMVNKTAYTLRADLTVRSDNIYVHGVDTAPTGFTYPTNSGKNNFIDVDVRVSGYNTDNQKQEVIDAVKGVSTGSAWSSFNWSASPTIKRSINAALRTVTDSQVTQWIEEARRAAWSAKDAAQYTEANGAKTGYDVCVLVPYLQVTVTDYQPGKSITMNLVPSWRVEVHQKSTNSYTLKDNDGIYVVKGKSGTALTGITGDLRGVDANNNYTGNGVVLDFKNLFTSLTPKYAHQDKIYDYLNNNGFNFTHAGTSGLGTVTIDATEPLIKVYTSQTNKASPAYFTTLQAAVDATEEGNLIDVDQKYSGVKTVNVTGDARTFYIQANGNNIVIANATGGLVDYNNTGAIHTVKLNRNTAPVKPPVAGKVTITVVAVTGGSASLSASRADEGETITVTLTPAANYRVGGVTVTAAVKNSTTGVTTNTTVSTTAASANSWRFVVPTGATSVTVTPSFVKVNTNATVTVSNPAVGGTAVTSAGNSQVAPGTPVSVTVSPATGYRTMGIYVTNATATRTGANTFSFIVPSGVTNVVVTPRFDRNNGTLFEDVWSTDYFSNAVGWAVGRGITNGDGSVYRFGTGKSCTREDMVTFLWRNAGSPIVTGVSNPFWDVQVGSYYYNAVMWAVKNGITKGVSANQFGVGRAVTRGEAVTFLYRAAGEPAASTNSGFYDVPSSEYYAKAVSWAVGKGITNGDGSTVKFSPNGYCLREQIVTFMYRNATGTRA